MFSLIFGVLQLFATRLSVCQKTEPQKECKTFHEYTVPTAAIYSLISGSINVYSLFAMR